MMLDFLHSEPKNAYVTGIISPFSGSEPQAVLRPFYNDMILDHFTELILLSDTTSSADAPPIDSHDSEPRFYKPGKFNHSYLFPSKKPLLPSLPTTFVEILSKFHHLNNSRSQRILWLLEELEVPYEIKKYDRDADQRAPKELIALNPLGKSPVITDGNITLAESGAIVEYLISKHGDGKFQAPESGYLDNLYFTHYAEGSLMPLLIQKLIFTMIPKKSPFLVRPLVNTIFGQLEKQIIQPEYKKHYDLIDAHLNKVTSWFAGGDHPTSADFQMAFPLEAIVTTAPNLASPKMKEYVKRVQERPAYKRGLEKGGPYAYAV